jgi:hypothetical protein
MLPRTGAEVFVSAEFASKQLSLENEVARVKLNLTLDLSPPTVSRAHREPLDGE